MENDLSTVIDRTWILEGKINDLIEYFVAPRSGTLDFFYNVLLDTSIISLGAKVKIVMAISQELDVKIKQDAFHKVVSIRNAFAHTGQKSNPAVFLKEDGSLSDTDYVLKIVKNTGKIESMTRSNAMRQFEKKYQIALKSISSLLEAAKNEFSANS